MKLISRMGAVWLDERCAVLVLDFSECVLRAVVLVPVKDDERCAVTDWKQSLVYRTQISRMEQIGTDD